ncbi:hypothetical protein [Serratia marcescens]|uniref:Uncharacterized protein n=1 Tax=Serratia marcescens TaxID=615 RepID=A0A9X8YPH2_SERMA|nr:hypothetical protein [Serratia marcescens]MBS3895147.1 hypothetical protein [Serratia marcescens]
MMIVAIHPPLVSFGGADSQAANPDRVLIADRLRREGWILPAPQSQLLFGLPDSPGESSMIVKERETVLRLDEMTLRQLKLSVNIFLKKT